jgi:AcrR family transcriptional regulator
MWDVFLDKHTVQTVLCLKQSVWTVLIGESVMPTRTNDPEAMRTRLIDSALATLQTHGISGLTLDAVARQAGVSKGGLLHHFANKDTLTEAILITLLDRFTAQVEALYETEAPRPGRWMRAYIRASLDDSDALPLEIIPMLASALLENPGLTAYLQRDIAQWRARLTSDGLPPARVDVLRYAADSVWQVRLIEGDTYNAADHAALFAELMRLAEVAS